VEALVVEVLGEVQPEGLEGDVSGMKIKRAILHPGTHSMGSSSRRVKGAAKSWEKINENQKILGSLPGLVTFICWLKDSHHITATPQSSNYTDRYDDKALSKFKLYILK